MTARPDITPDAAFAPIPSQELIDRWTREDAEKREGRGAAVFVLVASFIVVASVAFWCLATVAAWAVGVRLGAVLMGWPQ